MVDILVGDDCLAIEVESCDVDLCCMTDIKQMYWVWGAISTNCFTLMRIDAGANIIASAVKAKSLM